MQWTACVCSLTALQGDVTKARHPVRRRTPRLRPRGAGWMLGRSAPP